MNAVQSQPAKTRLLSLDFFRGLTVATMILVNNPGDWGHIYWPLEHSVWNGCTPTDLVFPFFLFMVGVSINYAIGPRKDDKQQHKRIILTAFKRAVMIYIIFIALDRIGSNMWNLDFTHFRVLGVLPRIAIVFFICAVLFVKTNSKIQLWLFFIILIVYYIIMNFIDVPGFGPSNLEKGTNLAAWLDNIVLTPSHMWSGTKTWDPEGVLSTLPAISTCLFGIQVGGLLRRKDKTDAEKTTWLFIIALFAIIAGLICNAFFPINKALWTSSFVLFTGGLATAGLATSFWLIDVQKRKKYIEPFVAFGSNAIAAYILADVMLTLFGLVHLNLNGHSVNLQQYLYSTVCVPYFSPNNASLVSAFAYILLLLFPIWILYRKKIFIKV